MKVAIVGATGAVGREMQALLAERSFPVDELRLLASARSAGATIDGVPVREATPEAFDGIDLALFSASSAIAETLAPAARDRGALVIDNSSAFRADPACPLVVPEINGEALARHAGIVANPNCSTILLAMALAPLRALARIERVVVCSYQAVSGAGAAAIEELQRQEAAEAAGNPPEAEVFPAVIAHNVMPWVGDFGDDGYSVEETKVRDELRRIFDRPELPVAATCVRVPVWRAHAEAIHVALDRPVDPATAAEAFRDAPGIVLRGTPADGDFPTPRDAAGKDHVFIGRIRADRAFEPGLALWCVMDQLRKGAALNAIQIAETVLGVVARAS